MDGYYFSLLVIRGFIEKHVVMNNKNKKIVTLTKINFDKSNNTDDRYCNLYSDNLPKDILDK